MMQDYQNAQSSLLGDSHPVTRTEVPSSELRAAFSNVRVFVLGEERLLSKKQPYNVADCRFFYQCMIEYLPDFLSLDWNGLVKAQQARNAYEFRNFAKEVARDLGSPRSKKFAIVRNNVKYGNDFSTEFDRMVGERMRKSGLTEDQAFDAIIASSMKTSACFDCIAEVQSRCVLQ